MDVSRVHVFLLFASFLLAVITLIDGFTNLSITKPDIPAGSTAHKFWTSMLAYELMVPLVSVFGLIVHFIGLHIGVIPYVPDTVSEAIFIVVGTTLHLFAWLAMGGIWTACEVGTFTSTKVDVNGQTTMIAVNRTGPPFCPQRLTQDMGYSLQGSIPKVKIAFAWLLFVLTLATLACACRNWYDVKHAQYVAEAAPDRRSIRSIDIVKAEAGGSAVPNRPRSDASISSTQSSHTYETKL